MAKSTLKSEKSRTKIVDTNLPEALPCWTHQFSCIYWSYAARIVLGWETAWKLLVQLAVVNGK